MTVKLERVEQLLFLAKSLLNTKYASIVTANCETDLNIEENKITLIFPSILKQVNYKLHFDGNDISIYALYTIHEDKEIPILIYNDGILIEGDDSTWFGLNGIIERNLIIWKDYYIKYAKSEHCRLIDMDERTYEELVSKLRELFMDTPVIKRVQEDY